MSEVLYAQGQGGSVDLAAEERRYVRFIASFLGMPSLTVESESGEWGGVYVTEMAGPAGFWLVNLTKDPVTVAWKAEPNP